jgi:adenylate cyclase
MSRRFTPLARKVNVIIVLSLVAGIGAITFFFGRSLSRTIENSTEDNLDQQTEILYTSIENFMLTGNAPIAVNFFDDIEGRYPDFSINLYRSNGEEAFTDNSTIFEVNELIGMEAFEPRSERDIPDPIPVLQGPEFDEAIMPPASTRFFRSSTEGEIFINTYKPLLNLPKCTGCHGSSHTVRGVIDIKTDITSSVMRQRAAIALAGGLFTGLVLVLALGITGFIRTTIIKPVKQIGMVCSKVTEGDFTTKVSVANTDEIGVLGRTVNTMVDGLHERFELTKYVSSSTLESLRSEKKGQRRKMTIFFSDIRAFTTHSEEQEPEFIVENLNRILNVQTELITAHGGDVDKYVGDEIVALFIRENPELAACLVALKIQREFILNSKTKYTGLEVGIGINSGEVVLGMIGSQQRADFTVVGDNVNTASRLCDVAKGNQILIAESVYRTIQEYLRVEGPTYISVKGKREPVAVYNLLGIHHRGEEHVL